MFGFVRYKADFVGGALGGSRAGVVVVGGRGGLLGLVEGQKCPSQPFYLGGVVHLPIVGRACGVDCIGGPHGPRFSDGLECQ